MVTLYRENALAFIDTKTGKVQEKLAVPAEPYGIVADRGGKRAWVTHEFPGLVTEIDLAAKKIVRQMEAGSFVRGIALGELTWGNSRKALIKEASVGMANGVILGVIAAVVAWATRGSPVLGIVLCAAMIINMFVAATAGTLVPLGLRAVNVDPALASSVFITTLTDVFGFFSFLGLATVFMRYLAPGG